MAPFSEAVKVEKAGDDSGVTVYKGEVDPTWSVGSVPNGGYVLALILEACLAHQARTIHPDALHLSAHYLKASTPGAFEVRVRVVKTGRAYANLSAELVQKGATRVMAHLIMGRMVQLPDDPSPRLALPAGSPHARRHPLPTHPSTLALPPVQTSARWRFFGELAVAPDAAVDARNAAGAVDRDAGTQSGEWMEFRDGGEPMTPAAVLFFADAFRGMMMALPKEARGYQGSMWYPTMTLTVQFLAPIPRAGVGCAPRTVGVYSRGNFLHDPQGRHDQYVEVWTAPCALGAGGVVEDDWREKAVCLAVSTQMALALPAEVNARLGAKL